MATSEPAVDQETAEQLNPIACSYCRQRKRKCDRNLPYCQQCSNDPANCHYPEQNKRGLPIGFITRLEARLAETEEALFRLVQSYEEPGNDQISLKPSSQRKDERIKEWDSLPLQSVEEVKAWYRNRAGQSGSSTRQDVPMVLDQQETPSRMTAPGEDHIDLDDAQDGLGADIALSDPELEVDSRREAQTSRVTDKGKAKEMEQKHPHMYF